MAATFVWDIDYGTATGSPARGTSTESNASNANWLNNADHTQTYSSYPITAGNNSYQVNLYGHFSGTYNQILSGLFAHTSGTLGTGLTLKGVPACTGDADRYLYVTPSTTADTNLTTDMTTAVSIGSGVAVCFSGTGPYATGKATSATANPAYTNYLTTQLQTSGSASPGDTAQITLQLQYAEN